MAMCSFCSENALKQLQSSSETDEKKAIKKLSNNCSETALKLL